VENATCTYKCGRKKNGDLYTIALKFIAKAIRKPEQPGKGINEQNSAGK
jgi:hypothetical protein